MIISLPCDLHGLVYSYLEWNEKLIFILVSKEISSLSSSYREMRLKKTFSLEYALNESFRERVCSLILPCHVKLDLSGCHDSPCTDATLIHLGNVHSLKLSRNHLVTDQGLRHLGNLHSLDLSSCRGITDAGLAYLGNLKAISLSDCHQVTDGGLRHLGNLQYLDLSCCEGFTDAGLAYLGSLKEINLCACRRSPMQVFVIFGTFNIWTCHLVVDSLMQLWLISGISRRSISHYVIESPMKVFVILATFNL
jgi:hypothetical protein